jgi:hypothetical protein
LDQICGLLSIPLCNRSTCLAFFRLPALGHAYAADVDPVEEHGQLGRLELDGDGAAGDPRQPKAAALQPLVQQHEAAVIPEEHLDAIKPLADENEQMPAVRVELPLGLDDRSKTIVTAAHVDGLAREPDLHASRHRQHRSTTASTTAPR